MRLSASFTALSRLQRIRIFVFVFEPSSVALSSPFEVLGGCCNTPWNPYLCGAYVVSSLNSFGIEASSKSISIISSRNVLMLGLYNFCLS